MKAAVLLALLPLLLAAAVVRGEPDCKTYRSKGQINPQTPALRDVLLVQDVFQLGDAAVTIDVSHRRVGALKVTLTAQPISAPKGEGSGRTLILKANGLGRLGADMFQTTFSDHAVAPFPPNKTGAPFTGTYRPTQRLSFFADGDSTIAGDGGSWGAWILNVEDVAPNATRRQIALNGWLLVLCERGGPAAAPPAPTVSAFSGPAEEEEVEAPTPAPAVALPPTTISAPAPSPAEAELLALLLGSPAPAPSVQAMNGPPDSVADPTTGTGAQQQPASTWFGWQVVVKGQPPASPQPGSQQAPVVPPVVLPGAAAPLASPTAALYGVGQHPLLGQLQQQVEGMMKGRYGAACTDPQCQNVKQQLWRAAIFALYAHSFAEAHGVAKADAVSWLDHMRDLLPGDNDRLGQLRDWVSSHKSEMRQLGDWVRTHVPAGSLHLPKPTGQALQQLLGPLGDGNLFNNFEGLTGLFEGQMSKLGERRQSGQEFLGELQGDNMQEVAQQMLALLGGPL